MTTTLDHRPALRLTPLEPHRETHREAPRQTPRPTTRRRTRRTTGLTNPTGWERNGDRRDRLHLALSELFTARADLGGVSVVADVLAEDLLWSA
jgi:hypothetical protein